MFRNAPLKAFRESLTEHWFQVGDSEADQVKFKQELVALGIDERKIPDGRTTRDIVIRLSQSKSIEIETLCETVLIWGRMRGPNKKTLFDGKTRKFWLSLAEEIRGGTLSRSDAYARFNTLAGNEKLKGMGPAYFTKLIHFLMPRAGDHPVGHIMDQWAGCSINVLADNQVVLMDRSYSWKIQQKKGRVEQTNFTVSKVNTGDNYEKFCTHIDALAQIIGLSVEDTDRALKSAGGRNPKAWRKYVLEHRNP